MTDTTNVPVSQSSHIVETMKQLIVRQTFTSAELAAMASTSDQDITIGATSGILTRLARQGFVEPSREPGVHGYTWTLLKPVDDAHVRKTPGGGRGSGPNTKPRHYQVPAGGNQQHEETAASPVEAIATPAEPDLALILSNICFYISEMAEDGIQFSLAMRSQVDKARVALDMMPQKWTELVDLETVPSERLLEELQRRLVNE